MEQERRERERRERARKEAERVRKERERQRELEKAREREREKERERFIRERKEREEKERRERELFERERLERERLERERKERERLEAERMERERQERQRLERERLEREAREKERLRLEREARIERERIERDQQRRSMNQGMKRSNPDYNRYPESKRSYRDEPEQSRKPFFGGAANTTDLRGNLKDDLYDMAYRRNVVDSKKERDYGESREFEGRRRSDPRGFPPPHKEASDIRRVVENTNNRYPPTRERSPHRPQQQYDNRSESTRYTNNNTRGNNEYERRDKTWLDAPNPNAPKTLSDVLGRAGLTGILGSKAEDNTRDRESGFAREPERGYGGAPLRNERPERNDYSRNPPARDDPYKVDNRQVEERRVVHPERRDSREGYRENARRESRPEERRFDDRRREGGEHHKDPYVNERSKDTFPRREPASSYGGNDNREKDTYGGVDRDRKDPYINSSNRKPERGANSRHELHERRDNRHEERRDSRSDERRDSYRAEHTKPIDRGINRQPPPSSSSQPRPDNRSVTERRGLHPLAAEIAGRPLPSIMQQGPRVVGPSTSVYGRVMQQPPALRPGFPPAGSQPVTVPVPPSIQLRDGRLEFTRVAPPGANIQPFPRRF